MLQTIKLSNYRNLNRSIELSPITVVSAPNGSGKSNLLEAIYLATTGSTLRSVPDISELIGPLDEFAAVDLQWDTYKLRLFITQKPKKAKQWLLGDKRKPRAEVIQLFQVMLFAPHNLELVSGEPELRRRELDSYLSLYYPIYSQLLDRYEYYRKQRNAIIKLCRDGKVLKSEWELFTNKLVEYASEVHRLRTEFFISVAPDIAQRAKQLELFGGSDIITEFRPNIVASPDEYAQVLRAKFDERYDRELLLGKTLYGPHKDDFAFISEGHELRFRASRGQQRLVSLGFKLAQLQLLQLQNPEKPSLLLLDDIMSELDEHHRITTAKTVLDTGWQMVLTTAVIGEMPTILLDQAQHLTLIS